MVKCARIDPHLVEIATEVAVPRLHSPDIDKGGSVQGFGRTRGSRDSFAVDVKMQVAGLTPAREGDMMPDAVVIAGPRGEECFRLARASGDVSHADHRHTEVVEDAAHLAIDKPTPRKPP